MPELATAWITLAVSATGMQRDIRRALNQVDGSGAGRKVGDEFSRAAGRADFGTLERKVGDAGRRAAAGLTKAFSVAAAGAATAGVGGLVYTLTKGFDRLKAIDTARFKLQALGNDAATVDQIMQSAQASVKGTAFNLAEAANAAASAVAAGVAPGQQLTEYLSTAADTAAVAGRSFEEMASIFNKIQTTNQVYLEDLQQLPGVPIFQWLQEEYGVTADALSDMVSRGEVDAAHFQSAIDKHIGGAALKTGESFEGSVQNLQASVARLGANFLTAIFGGEGVDALAGPTEAVTVLTQKFDQMGGWVKANGPRIHDMFVEIGDDVKIVAGVLGDVAGFLADHPRLVGVAVGAFAAFKTVQGISALITSLEAVALALGTTIPAKAALARTALSTIVLPAAVVAGLAYLYDQGTKPPTPGSEGQRSRIYIPPEMRRRPQPGTSSQSTAAGRASGGSIFGPGGPKSDLIPIWASNGEHMLSAADVNAMGGQSGVYAFRKALHRGDGGAVTDEELIAFARSASGGRYAFGASDLAAGLSDCSGAISDLVELLTKGQADAGRLFSTGNARQALTQLGAVEGALPGALQIGWVNGGPGGGHMRATLPNGVAFESGGGTGQGATYGGRARGAAGMPNIMSLRVAGEATGAGLTQAFADGLNEGGRTEVDRLKESAPTSGTPGGDGMDASSFGQSLVSGILQGIGLDGSVFSNPFDWPNVKSAMALANWGGGMIKNAISGSGGGGVPSGGGLPGVRDFLKPLTPGQPLTPTRPDAVGGGSTDPARPSFVVNGNVGMDPRALTQRFDAAHNQAYRRNLSAVRPGN